MFTPDSNIAGDFITNANTLTFHGTGQTGSIINIFDGATLLGTTVVDGAGSWSFKTFDPTGSAPTLFDPDDPPPVEEPQSGNGISSTFSDGIHVFTAIAKDAAGNASAATAALTITIDTAAPAAPVISTTITNDTGTSASDHITSDNTVLLTGSAEANSTVTISDGVTCSARTANGTGAWSYTTAALLDGAHSLTAKATDTAGNVGAASSALSVTIDTRRQRRR